LVIRHDFNAIDGQLDALTADNTQLGQLREQLDAELTRWAGYWTGDAHEQATAFTRHVTSTLDQTIMASQQYVEKARLANSDMRGQEAANTSLWA
jgi:hypothetical protein